MTKGTFIRTKVTEYQSSLNSRTNYHVQLVYQTEEGESLRTIYGIRNKAKAHAIAEFLEQALRSEYTMFDLNCAHASYVANQSYAHEIVKVAREGE